MEVILIRHGEPVVAESQHEPVDPELSPLGDWQAERVSRWLACEPIDHIIASDKRRAIETVTPLAERLEMQIEIVPELAEIDRFAKVYAPFHLLPERFPDYWAAIQSQDWEAIGWDSLEAFNERVRNAFQRLIEQRPGNRVAVACHGGVIGSISAHILGVAERWSLAVPPFASLTRIAAPPDTAPQILTLNEVAHFDTDRNEVIGPRGPDGIERAG